MKSTLSKNNLLNIISCAVILLLFASTEKVQFLLPFLVLTIILLRDNKHLLSSAVKGAKEHLVAKAIIVLFVYQFLNYIFALVNKRADALTFPLFVSSFYLVFVFLILPNKDSFFTLKKTLKFMVIAQALLVIIYGIFVQRNLIIPGDWARGTVLWSYWLGICLVWLLFNLFLKDKWKMRNILLIAVLSYVLFLTGSKTVIFVSIISTLILMPIILYFYRKKAFKYLFKMSCFVIILSLILLSNLGVTTFHRKAVVEKKEVFTSIVETQDRIKDICTQDLVNSYVDGEVNHKVLFIKRGFEYIWNNRLFLIGTSPGTLGTRASNLRARDILYKPDGSKLNFLPVYSSPATKKVYDKLYTEEYFKQAGHRSSTLAMPFSGFFAFFFENGLIGIIFLFFILTTVVKSFLKYNNSLSLESVFLLLSVFLLGIFDTVWERPFIMGFLYLVLGTNYYEIKNK